MALFVTSPCQGITLHPALRSPDFPPRTTCTYAAAAKPTPACNFTPRSGAYKALRRWTLKRRLYFLLPDVASATRTANDLLLARVEDRRMHFLAKRGTDLGELHEAGYLFKTDLVRGAGFGLALGLLGGVVLGSLIVNYPPEGTHPGLGAAVIATIVGAALGVWMGSMAAVAVPNSRLKSFNEEIGRGKVLLILDVPYREVDRIREIVASRHPEVVLSAQETRYPAFP